MHGSFELGWNWRVGSPVELDLRNKRVVITGSSRGIGYGIARGFLEEGAQVMLTGRDDGLLTRRCRSLRRSFGVDRICSFSGDLTDADNARRLAEKCGALWDGLDILVLNLGSGRSVPGADIPDSEWQRMLDLNLIAGVRILRLLLPLLKRSSNSSVTVVGSIAGLESLGAPVAYGAAKAALLHTVKSMATLLAPQIRLNMVAPGNIYFKGGTWDTKLQADPRAVARMLKSQVPMRRFGKVSEIADIVLFLASRRASFMTGACVVVDGGQTRSL